MRIQYIVHADFELPGAVEMWAKRNGLQESLCRPFAGENVPRPDDYDLLVVMGGPQSASNIEEAPYLAEEIALIRKTIGAGIPVLGICLGAQLIGEALGARTERSPNKEIGVFPIELTEEGLNDPLLRGLPTRFSVAHWHNDMPGLTAEAAILAGSRGCPRQIIRYSPLVYGFQCHPEINKGNMQAMVDHCSGDLSPGEFIQAREELLDCDFAKANELMDRIMDNLVLSLKERSESSATV